MRNILAEFVERQQRRLALFLPVFLGAGICVYFGQTAEPSLPASWAAAAALGIAAAALRRRPIARAPLLALAAAALGFALAATEAARQPPFFPVPRRAVFLEGRVAALEALPAGRRVVLEAPRIEGAPPEARSMRIRLRHSDATAFAPGATISVRAMLQPPSPPELPGGWDTQRAAYFEGLGAYGFALEPVTVRQEAAASWLPTLRAHLSAALLRGLPGAQGGIASALLTGLGAAIPADDRAAFATAGLAHLLAVAGLHIGIVMGLTFFTLRFALASWEWAALRLPVRQVAALAALGVGLVYLLLTGAHLPILRSFAMATLVTLGVVSGRRAISLRGLALAGTVLLTAAPHLIVEVSFQMSFSAVLWLVAGYELARPALAGFAPGRRWRKPGLYAAGLALSSVLAGTGSMPFSAYHFGRGSLYSVPANMLAVPITAFWVMPWGLAALLLWPLGLMGLALVPMGWGIAALLAIAHAVASWPDANLPVPLIPAWCLALIALGFAWGGILRGRVRALGIVPVAAGVLAPVLLPGPDAFVGTGAHVLAVRANGAVLADIGRGASPFEREAVLRLWGLRAAPALQRGMACDAAGCTAGPVFVATGAPPAACRAALVLSHARLAASCGQTVIDRDYVAQSGSAAIWIRAGGLEIRTVSATRGVRPWVLAAQPRLPMAESE